MSSESLQPQTLAELRAQLEGLKQWESILGKKFEKPLKSLEDGYPENTVNWLSIISEALLKKIWRFHKISGDPSHKMLDDLLNVLKSHLPNRRVVDYFYDIKALRNRGVHDNEGGEISVTDALEGLRKIIFILQWAEAHMSFLHTQSASILVPLVAYQAEFIVGLYKILSYQLFKCQELTSQTCYLLFHREIGIKNDYIEVVISNSLDDLIQFVSTVDTSIFQTQYPIQTRFIITDEWLKEKIKPSLSTAICSLESFVGRFINYPNYLTHLQHRWQNLPLQQHTMRGELLVYSTEKQDYTLQSLENIDDFLVQDNAAEKSGNLFVIAPPGGGKTFFCRKFFHALRTKNPNAYIFHFDLSHMKPGESFENFITQQIHAYFDLDIHRVFDVLYYLNQTGQVVTLLDGFDEIFDTPEINTVLEVFSEISKIFSVNSRVVITSRYSFFSASKHVREILNRNALVSEKITYGLTAVGIDPFRLPNFKLLKLQPINLLKAFPRLRKLLQRGESANLSSSCVVTPLILSVIQELNAGALTKALEKKSGELLAAPLVQAYLQLKLNQLETQAKDDLIEFFTQSFFKGQKVFSLAALFNYVSGEIFEFSELSYQSFLLADWFYAINDYEIRFKHKCFYELLAAWGYVEYGIQPETTLSETLTDQVRQYINELVQFKPLNPVEKPGLVPAGYYILGDFDQAHLRYLNSAIVMDIQPVKVREFNEFMSLSLEERLSYAHRQHPSEVPLEPQYSRLKIKDYFDNPDYAEYPAVCIPFWSAYAYARWKGKRLPTSIEWECAARGPYGNLFAWGNELNIQWANCADYWAQEELIDFEGWKAFFGQSEIRGIGTPLPVLQFPENISYFGMLGMCGNVWELTESIDIENSVGVICGGSFDNPYKAIKCSSKGIYNLSHATNVVGFRCCEDLK